MTSSERFLIGEGFRKEKVDLLTQHLQNALQSLEDSLDPSNFDGKLSHPDYDSYKIMQESKLETLHSIVPISIIKDDSELFYFLYDLNLM
jgi:hypothetical protein